MKSIFSFIYLIAFCFWINLNSMHDQPLQLQCKLSDLKVSLTQLKTKLDTLNQKLDTVRKQISGKIYSGYIKISLNLKSVELKTLDDNLKTARTKLTALLKNISGKDFTGRIRWKIPDDMAKNQWMHISLREFFDITKTHVDTIISTIPMNLSSQLTSAGFGKDFNNIHAYEIEVFVAKDYPSGYAKQKQPGHDRITVVLKVVSVNKWLEKLVEIIDSSLIGIKDLPERAHPEYVPHITILMIDDITRLDSEEIKKKIESSKMNLSSNPFKLDRKFDFRYGKIYETPTSKFYDF
jgi:hypothetical protein